MPITSLQSDILRVIAASRDPESFIAGGVPINRAGPRVSEDIDVFHDREERVAQAALADAKALTEAGFGVRWLRQQPAVYSAAVGHGGQETKIEWVADSDYRYFPTVKDPQFGYVLHIVDLMLNKTMAAASRREPRDIVDLVTLHQRILPLGAAIWCAVAVSPGYTPEGLIAEIRRNSRYPAEELSQLKAEPPVDPVAICTALRQALNEAEQFVRAMPSGAAGRLFLDNGRPAQPDPQHLDRYSTHAPRQRGHWPSSPEITTAMLDYLQRPPA